jgi:hypothetical protein
MGPVFRFGRNPMLRLFLSRKITDVGIRAIARNYRNEPPAALGHFGTKFRSLGHPASMLRRPSLFQPGSLPQSSSRTTRFHPGFGPASMPKQAGQITSWVCPKQHLALCIKAAFSRNITRVKVASIVERAVPTASLSPFAPSYVIAILAVGISSFPGRAKDALGGVPWTGDYVPGHRGPCHYRKKNCGCANQFEFRHASLLSVW